MLAKDIDAISKLADIKGARARYQIAIVEGTDGSMSIRGGNSNVREHIEEVFATADPESRIAIAYSDSFPGAGGGAWASVARGFCSENISGVLLVEGMGFSTFYWDLFRQFPKTEKDRVTQSGVLDAEPWPIPCLKETLPQALIETRLPILYDTAGVLEAISPHSEKLDLDPSISIANLDERKHDKDLVGIGCWSGGVNPFPLRNITSTPLAKQVVRARASLALSNMESTCRARLHAIVPEDAANQNLYPAYEATAFLKGIFGDDVVNDDLLLSFGRPSIMAASGMDNIPYACELDWDSVEGWDDFELEVGKIQDICSLMTAALDERNLAFYPERDPKTTISKFKALMECFGVVHQVQALCEGVPIEDILAS